MNKKVIIGILVVIVLVLLFACSGKGYKDTAIECIEAMLDGDTKKFVSTFSEELIEELMIENDCSSKKLLISNFDKKMDKVQEMLKDELGKKWKYKVEYIDSELEDDMCIVYLDVTFIEKNWIGKKFEEKETLDVYLIKEGRNWRVYSYPDLWI